VIELPTMKSETRRLNKLKDTSHNLAKRYRLPQAALKIIEKAGEIHVRDIARF
jgi:response regulator RpfG family c-di-GMP phosphodiesterase